MREASFIGSAEPVKPRASDPAGRKYLRVLGEMWRADPAAAGPRA